MKAKSVIGLVVIAVVVVAAFFLWPNVAQMPGEDPVPAAPGATDRVPEPSTIIRGAVVDVEGRPIADATVRTAGAQARTDTLGRFELLGAPTGTVRITAEKDGYIADGPLGAAVDAHVSAGAELEGVALVLREPGTLSGQVTADGEPVPARLSLFYAGEQFAVDGVGESGADGTFVLADIPPGRVRILVETDAFALTESREVDLHDGETVENLAIELSTGGSVEGDVVDDEGNPVSTADVYLVGETGPRARHADVSDAGAFRFDGVPAGAARLRVVATGFGTGVIENVTVTPGEVTQVDIVLEAVRGTFGRVIDPDGEAFGGAFVVRGDQQARTDDEGRFSFDAVSANPVVAVAARYAPSDAKPTVTGEEVVLQLRPGGTVSGRVVDSAGAPVTEFEIGVDSFEVEGPDPYDSREVGIEPFVSSDGTFRFGPLRPGRYWFRASAPGHAPGEAGPIVVRSETTAGPVEIRLTGGGTVRGTVTDEGGQPLRGAAVSVFDPMSPFRTSSTRSDDQGRYELAGVSPGRRSLRVAHRGYLTTVSGGLEVPAGAAVTRDITLGERERGEKFQFHGIGAVLRKEGDAIEILQTIEDRPAALFGLQEGDRILAVDGESTADLNLGNVVELVRGEEGVAVVLEIERENEGRLEVSIERGRVVVK